MTTRLPLRSLNTEHGPAVRVADVGRQDVRDLLRDGAVRFIIVDVGKPLRWIAPPLCFEAWKDDVQPHLAEPHQKLRLEEWPNGYAYFAARWDDGTSPIIVFEKVH